MTSIEDRIDAEAARYAEVEAIMAKLKAANDLHLAAARALRDAEAAAFSELEAVGFERGPVADIDAIMAVPVE